MGERGAITMLSTSAVPPPPAIFPGLNNVYGKAKFKQDSGVVKYLGQFNATNECVAACLAFDRDGDTCFSFTHHLLTMPTNWKGLCFAITDHTWAPVPDTSTPPVIASGRVSWPEDPCGPDAPAGCTWQVDPWCLQAQHKYGEVTATTVDAAAACSSDANCAGFSLIGPNSSSATHKVVHSLFNSTAGGPGGCWSHRRHFALKSDPYRTAFHFQPKGGFWMNDPNGPMYYGGVYHLFFQHNPISSEAYNMHWGHAVSADMVHWLELPLALAPDEGNECGGEWSGSATPGALVGGGVTASSKRAVPVLSVSVQCNSFFLQAEPADPTDPLLVNWTKPSYNPSARKPPHTGGFRDPSEAWLGTDGVWRQVAACSGGACLFNSTDFMHWKFDGMAVYPYGPPPNRTATRPRGLKTAARATALGSAKAAGGEDVPAHEHEHVVGMNMAGGDQMRRAKTLADGDGNPPTWECPDLFVLPRAEGSAPPLWVLKASGGLTPASAKIGVDFWATGTFVEANGSFVHGANSDALPSDLQRIDFGNFYASKTFYDPVGMQRVVYGWVLEEESAPLLDWRGVQSAPRAIHEDPLFPNRLVFTPVEALRSLRTLPPVASMRASQLQPHATTPLPSGAAGARLDVELAFAPPFAAGSSFGLSVLGGAANVTVDLAPDAQCGNHSTMRAPKAVDTACANLTIGTYHGPFRFRVDEPLHVRVLVDSSIVESFAADGRAAVTARAYPASSAPLSLALINHGASLVTVTSAQVYAMAADMDAGSVDKLRSEANKAKGQVHP